MTSDEQYVRKGVELADGWSDRDFDDGVIFGELSDEWYLQDFGWPQSMLDAIAAQLVRQVDALDDREYELDLSRDEVWLGYTDSYEGIVRIAKVRGPDRTMNTIKAVVDFAEANPGVLG